MKKILILKFISILLTTNCFSQSVEKDKYIIKAKNQNTCGWFLALGGTALHIAAFAIESSVPILDFNATPEELKSNKNKEKTAEVLLIAGAVALVGCIPLFVSSHINHKKSLHVTINMKSFNQLNANKLYAFCYPALGLKIDL